jgi:N6-L-threonylcarbamoyladenine synthase
VRFLAIDTSCDETSVAVTDGTKILSNVVSSQIKYHKAYGGVVPMLAARLHTERIDSVVQLALKRSKLSTDDLDAVAVTYGPGLAPALQVGILKAKELAAGLDLPLYAINHMHGHVASVFVGKEPVFPVLAVLVSGGHSDIALVESMGKVTILGETLDDALGEAYDKVAKMLGLGYPGGKVVSKLASQGQPDRFHLPIPMNRKDTPNLSYSGLKNAVRLLIAEHDPLTGDDVKDICAAFEQAAQASLLRKVKMALETHGEVAGVLMAGGVAANVRLRRLMRQLAAEYGLPLLLPPTLAMCTDNAAMIGIAAELMVREGLEPAILDELDRTPGLRLDDAIDFR